jgi:hypothetical protein
MDKRLVRRLVDIVIRRLREIVIARNCPHRTMQTENPIPIMEDVCRIVETLILQMEPISSMNYPREVLPMTDVLECLPLSQAIPMKRRRS